VAFALASKAFALAVGENEGVLTKARWAPLPLALLSLLLQLPPLLEMGLGIAIVLLYLTYPALIRARERPPSTSSITAPGMPSSSSSAMPGSPSQT
jgi:hypothetical protein